MIIGIPRERKTLEKRVALTPAGAFELISRKHQVLIEKNAGAGALFSDADYEEVGCEIVTSLEEVWSRAELLVKVKEPHESEYQYFREDLVLFDYLHLAGLPEVAEQLVKHKVLGIAYELVSKDQRHFPLLEPMSEIAGKLSVLNGSHYLLSHRGGRGVLLGGAVGVLPAKVLIIGAGIAGKAACRTALGLDAQVTVLDINHEQLEAVKNIFHNQAATAYSNEKTLIELAAQSDLVIGAVLVPGDKAPRVITKQVLDAMPASSVVVDISIDQGGCVEDIKPTSLEEPTYVSNGVLHYAVPNMPSQVARTATLALTATTLPYIIRLAEHGAEHCIQNDIELRNACCTHKGEIVNNIIAKSLE